MILNKFSLASIMIVPFLLVIVVFQLFGYSLDYQHYLRLYNYEDTIQADTKEVYFYLVRYFLNDIFGAPFYFFILSYVALSVSLKIYTINVFSKIPAISFFVYLFVFFPLHDYTQIRVAAVSAILLFVLRDLSESKIMGASFKVFFAILFHWSAIFFLIIIVFFYFRNRFLHVFLVFLGFVFYFSGDVIYVFFNWLTSFNIYTENYFRSHSGHFEVFNVFNVLFILNLVLYFLLFLAAQINKKIQDDDFFYFLLLSYSFSIFFYLSTSVLNMPVISMRIYELFNVVVVFLFPYLFLTYKPFIFPLSFSFFYVAFYFYYYLFVLKIFSWF